MLKFTDFCDEVTTRSDQNILCCPVCGGNNLHQGTVTVDQRLQEDGDSRRTMAPGDGNPPLSAIVSDADVVGRRSSLAIEFSCEHCHCGGPGHHSLTIMQHKGSTFFEWVTDVIDDFDSEDKRPHRHGGDSF